MQARLRYWSGEGNLEFRTRGDHVAYSMVPFDAKLFANSMQVRRARRKKHLGPDSPLYTVLYPMICIIKLFGLAPYEFSRDQMVPSDTLLIFSALFSVIYTYEIYVNCVGFQTPKKNRVYGWTWFILVLFNFVVAMYEILLAIFTRKSFVRVWNAIQDYDEAVRQLGHPRKEVRTGIVAWIVLIGQGICWTMVNQTGMYAFGERWLHNVVYMSIYIGTSVAVYKFVGTVYLLAQRFSHLAELATKNLPPRSGFMNTSKVTRKTVQDLHNDLMVTGERLESMYCCSLFLWLMNLSMHSVSNTFFILKWITQPVFGVDYIPLVSCYGAWLLSFLMQLVLIHTVCDEVSKRASDIHIILIDWNVRLAKRFPETEVVESSIHLLNRKLQFSAGGCFHVNLPLLRSIVAVLSTYLFILLQFPE